MEGKVCTKCGVWKPLEEYHKDKRSKDGRRPKCKECAKKQSKQHYQNNKEHCKEQHKQHYHNNKEYYKKQHKQWYQNNKEHRKEQMKQWKEGNKEYCKEYYQNNKEHYKEQKKQYYQNNKEHRKEQMKQYSKQHYQNNKENNLQYISSIVEQINPVFKQLNLPVYGYVYMFENIKTGHKYLGQTIQPISRRYKGGIVQGWIKDRKHYQNQKFKEELIEEDFIVTEILDVAFCQYHLDKLEAYWINYSDSYNNGYNNREGNHNTDDGIEEFNQILSTHNLEYKDGKIIKSTSSEIDQ